MNHSMQHAIPPGSFALHGARASMTHAERSRVLRFLAAGERRLGRGRRDSLWPRRQPGMASGHFGEARHE